MGKTTGQILKKSMGLEQFPYVYVASVYRTSPRIQLVLFDSFRNTRPLTKREVMNRGKFDVYRDGTGDPMDFTPLIPIEQFGGNLSGTYLRIDLAFDHLSKKESVVTPVPQLYEYVTMADLKAKDATSEFTTKTKAARTKEMGGGENINSKLIDCYLSKADGTVTFAFLTEATTGYPKDHKYKSANPEKNWALFSDPSKTYEIQIKLLDFYEWLDTHPKGEVIKAKDIKEILEVSNVQVSSTSPSFHWQGMNYWISQLDGSIYPTSIVPKRWNAEHLHGDGNAFLDKHLSGLMRQISFFENPMASMLTKKLKDRGEL